MIDFTGKQKREKKEIASLLRDREWPVIGCLKSPQLDAIISPPTAGYCSLILATLVAELHLVF
ncbi:MAG: hypothetical protein WCP35_20185 [Verrucomicrobiota bacterium]